MRIILNAFLITFFLDAVIFVIPKVQSYYLQFEPEHYDGEINISGSEKSKEQSLTNILISLVIYLFFIYLLYSNKVLSNYILQPLTIIFYLHLLYFYGKYVYELVFKNKKILIIDEFKNRRYLLQFKIYWLFVLGFLSTNELSVVINFLIPNESIAEFINIFFDLIYQSTIIILLLDSISWIIKDTLILFNLQKINKVKTHEFVYKVMHELENKNDNRWKRIVDRERFFRTIIEFIFYIIFRFFTTVCIALFFIAQFFDKSLNGVISLINKFMNKNLYTFPRIIFIGVLVYYYINLNSSSQVSEVAKETFEFISTIFIIPLLLDELSRYK